MKKKDYDFEIYNEKGEEMSLDDFPEEVSGKIIEIFDAFKENKEKIQKRDSKKSEKKNDKKSNIPNKSNIIMFEDSIDENGEVNDNIKDLLRYAEKCNTPVLSSDDSITVVETEFDLKDHRISPEKFHEIIDENSFRNRTNIMVDSFDYNMNLLGFDGFPNTCLSLEVIEGEYNVSEIDIALRLADILNFSLKTNMFIPILDPITDCAYVKCEVGDNKELYTDEEFINKVVAASVAVICDAVEKREEDYFEY